MYFNAIYYDNVTVTHDELLPNKEVQSGSSAVSVPAVKRAVYAIYTTFELKFDITDDVYNISKCFDSCADLFLQSIIYYLHNGLFRMAANAGLIQYRNNNSTNYVK